jgi:hypothetical protein
MPRKQFLNPLFVFWPFDLSGSCENGEDGIRTLPEIQAETAISVEGGAISGASATESRPIDPGLARIVEAWPSLPGAIRNAMLALAGSGG